MQLKLKLIYSGITSVLVFLLSIFTPIIPCQKFPNIPNSIHKWTLCTLNPDQITSLNSITRYLGYTSSLKETYVLVILISFIAAMVFFHYFASKKIKK